MQWVAWAILEKRRIDPSSLFNISIYVLIESIIINCGFFLSLPFLRFHIKVKDTFFSIEDGNSDIFFAYYRARTPEFLLEASLFGVWVDFFSQYLLMKERAPVIVRNLGAHLRLNRVITQQVRRAFGFSYSKLIHNLNIQE
ncbi:hypothetical protein ACJX0J_001987 [Zea mays]